MRDRWLQAVKESIEKWEAIVAGSGVDFGVANCPLCKVQEAELDGDWDDECPDCPVKLATGEDDCEGSPYDSWVLHHSTTHLTGDTNAGVYGDSGLALVDGCEECGRVAREELQFLKSLLPENRNS